MRLEFEYKARKLIVFEGGGVALGHTALASGAWTAIEWVQPSSTTLLVGAVRSVTPVSNGPGLPSLEDAVNTDGTPLGAHLDGAVIVDGPGALVGFVNGRLGQRLVELPAHLAASILAAAASGPALPRQAPALALPVDQPTDLARPPPLEPGTPPQLAEPRSWSAR